MAQGCGPFVSRLEFAQGAGKLVGAAGASAVALDSFKAGDGIGHLHAGYESAYALKVAVAAAGEAYAADAIGLGFYVYEFRADKGAGLERSAADAVFCIIGYQCYVKHWCLFWVGKDTKMKKYNWGQTINQGQSILHPCQDRFSSVSLLPLILTGAFQRPSP